jgi:uncharacterized spore protein YtfJ
VSFVVGYSEFVRLCGAVYAGLFLGTIGGNFIKPIAHLVIAAPDCRMINHRDERSRIVHCNRINSVWRALE